MGEPESYDALEIVEDQTQLGRYRLVGELASGGMATVHLALETEGLGRLVALKTMHPHLTNEPDYVDMFLDEARINGAIDHPNVCKVFDFGQADGRYFIAMEQLSGHTLKDLIGRVRAHGRPQDYCSLVVQIVAAACDGLHAAHELRDHDDQPLSVVHRDVSPQNLYLGYDGRLRVVDFGIAHATGRIQHTSEGVVKGKFSYIAPEQIRSGDIDCRVDIWSVGVVLWELLTLKRLFVRATHADTLMSVMMDPLKAPSEIAGDVPSELDAVALRALSRDREGRFASAKEMAESLRRIVDDGILPARSEAEVATWMQALFAPEQAARREMMNLARDLACGGALGPLSVSASQSSRGPRRTSGVVARVRAGGDGSAVRLRKTSAPPALPTQGAKPAQPPAEAVAVESAALEAVEPSRLTELPSEARSRMGAAKWVVMILGAGLAVVAALLVPEPPLPGASIDAAAPLAGRDVTAGVPSERSAPDQVDAKRATEVDAKGVAMATPKPALAPPNTRPETQRAIPTPSTAVPPSAARGVHVARLPQPKPVRAKPQRAVVRPKSEASTAAEPPSNRETMPARGSSKETATAPTPSGPSLRANPFGEGSGADAPGAADSKPTAKSTAASSAGPASVDASASDKATAARASAPAPKPVRAPSPPPYVPRAARVTVNELSVQGPLSSSTVSHMLARADGPLQKCYSEASARARRHDTHGISGQFTIDEMGATRDVRVGSHPLPGLSACASTALKRLRSAKRPDTGRAQVSLKLQFNLR